MKSRYFIAIEIEPRIVSKLRAFYQDNFLSKMPVKNIHLTLLAPFFVKENRSEEELVEKMKEIKFIPFTAKFTDLDIFEQKSKKILYAKVEPENKFFDLSEKVKILLDGLVKMDETPYTSGEVPSFKAHVTLNYNFREVIPETFPDLSFLVEDVVVFKEENEEWTKL